MSDAPSPHIHGHEVLQMMSDSGQSFSRDSLIAAVEARFGKTARFYICCADGMDATCLVDTLIAKGKFMGPPDAFVFNPATRCDH